MQYTPPGLQNEWGSISLYCWEKNITLIKSRDSKDILNFIESPKNWYPVIKVNEILLYFSS